MGLVIDIIGNLTPGPYGQVYIKVSGEPSTPFEHKLVKEQGRGQWLTEVWVDDLGNNRLVTELSERRRSGDGEPHAFAYGSRKAWSKRTRVSWFDPRDAPEL